MIPALLGILLPVSAFSLNSLSLDLRTFPSQPISGQTLTYQIEWRAFASQGWVAEDQCPSAVRMLEFTMDLPQTIGPVKQAQRWRVMLK